MKVLSWLLIFCLAGCGSVIVRDFNEASIDQGHKRVETIICDRHDVGENGCVFQEGASLGVLKVFAVGSGSLTFAGCDSNYSLRYTKTGWLDIPLSDVVKTSVDCSLDIFMSVDFPRQESAQFPIRGMYGTVTIGRCPPGVLCSFNSVQLREGESEAWLNDLDDSGAYLVRSCGVEVDRGNYDGNLIFELADLIPEERRKGKDGCAVILSIRGEKRYKKYYKVWFYVEQMIPVQLPALDVGEKKVKFVSDKSITLSVVNQKLYGQKGSFRPSATGDFLRFYSTQGRSLVVFFKDGEIVWKK